jgi:hypothetical protein
VSAIDQARFNHAAQVWQKACDKLGVKIITPFLLKAEDETINCLEFLPDFGGNQGMVIGAMDLPEVATDDRYFRLARKKNLFCSIINVNAYAKNEVDETVFKEALNDWGFFGNRDDCPAWFNGCKGSRALP